MYTAITQLTEGSFSRETRTNSDKEMHVNLCDQETGDSSEDVICKGNFMQVLHSSDSVDCFRIDIAKWKYCDNYLKARSGEGGSNTQGMNTETLDVIIIDKTCKAIPNSK